MVSRDIGKLIDENFDLNASIHAWEDGLCVTINIKQQWSNNPYILHWH